MHRFSRAASALLALSLAGCGGSEVVLVLKPGVGVDGVPFDTSQVRSLHVKLTSNGKSKEESLALDAARLAPLDVGPLDGQHTLHVDVLGCDGDTCDVPTDASFHGCSRPDVALPPKENPVPVDIPLFPVGNGGAAGCGPP